MNRNEMFKLFFYSQETSALEQMRTLNHVYRQRKTRLAYERNVPRRKAEETHPKTGLFATMHMQQHRRVQKTIRGITQDRRLEHEKTRLRESHWTPETRQSAEITNNCRGAMSDCHDMHARQHRATCRRGNRMAPSKPSL